METVVLEYLGPYTGWIQAAALATVVLARKSLRKRHVLSLAAASALSFIAFFALLLWGVATLDGSQDPTLLNGVLRVLAAIVVGCGSGVGFSLILAKLRLATLEDR